MTQQADPTHSIVEARDFVGQGLTCAFRLMTDRELVCFVMCYLGGQPQERIARALGVSQSAVSQKLDNALKKVGVIFHPE